MIQYLLNYFVKGSYSTSKYPTHLIVLQHGYGSPWIRQTPLANYFCNIANMKSDDNNSYLVHIIKGNSNDYCFGLYRTQLGICVGGKRTADEIKNVLEKYSSINKISFIGGSLGGLYNRYAVKVLYNALKSIQCINFVTLGTPHLGVDDWVKNKRILCGMISLYKGASILSEYKLLPKTLEQLLKLDCNGNNIEQTLIYKMCNDKEYLNALNLFENKIAYANSINDNRVSCSSGLLLKTFNDINENKLVNEMFYNDIKKATERKESFISKVNQNYNDKSLWWNKFDETINFDKYCVSMNSGWMDKKLAHTWVSNPVNSYKSCEPLLNHISKTIKW